MLYRPGDSALHRAAPLTKLAALPAVAAMLPLWPAPLMAGGLLVLVATGVLTGVGGALIRRLAVVLLPLALGLTVVHGLLIARGPAVEWGLLSVYPQGLAHAFLVLVRLALLLTACLLFVLTTRLGDLARALDGAGVPPSVSYLLTAPLMLVEGITDEIAHIRDSLRLRGIPARPGLRGRLHLLRAAVAPLVRGLITEAPMRAELLDTRGFRALPRRGALDPVSVPAPEIWLQRALLGVALLQVAALL